MHLSNWLRLTAAFKACSVIVILALVIGTLKVQGQQTLFYTDAEQYYKQGYELYLKEKYSAAIGQFEKAIHQKNVSHISRVNATYYSAVCSAELFNKNAEQKLLSFINQFGNENKAQLAAWQLAKVYYREKQWKKSVPWFDKTDVAQLSTDEVPEFYFKSAYAYFLTNDLIRAAKNFHQIIGVPSKYQTAANFYYAHIAYVNGNYETALKSFNSLDKSEAFAAIAPYYIAQIYFQQAKYDDVIKTGLPALQNGLPSNEIDLKRLVAEAYYRKGNFTEAANYLEMYQKSATSIGRTDMYQLGYSYYKAGLFEKAITAFNKVINIADSIAQNANYHLADCFLKTGNKPAARNAFQFASKGSFDTIIQEDALFNFGKLSYEAGATSAAINAFKEYIKSYPKNPKSDQAFEYLAQAYLTTKDYKQALSALESIQAKSPNAKAAYQKVAYYRGVELYNDGDMPKAIGMFDKGILNNNDAKLTAKAMYWKAEALYKQQSFDAAIKEYRIFLFAPAATNLDFYNNVYYNLGYCYIKKENYQEALNWFRKYINDKDPTDINRYNDAHIRIADAAFVLRDYATATAHYNIAIKANHASSDYCYFQLGMLEGLQGNVNAKILAMQQIENKFAKSIYVDDAVYEKGNALLVKEDFNSALNQFDKVITQYPNSNYLSKARLKRGLIYFNQGNNKNAIEAYKDVVTKHPNSNEANEALEGMKNAFIKEGKPDEFINFANNLPGPKIASGAQDTIFYSAAEDAYQKEDYSKASEAFDTYLKRFAEGAYRLHATFYKAKSDYFIKNYDSALIGFESILNQSTSDFTEESLAKAAILQFYKKNYQVAATYFKSLEQTANYKDNIIAALAGQMRCYYLLNDDDACITATQKLLETSKLSSDLMHEAHLYYGRSALRKEDWITAQKAYAEVNKVQSGARAAEAKYALAVIEYKLKNFKQVAKRVAELDNMNPSYDYWLAKAYLVLGDSYLAQGDTFQAKGTFKSIAENYERNADDADDVRQIATQKYEALIADENKIFRKEDEPVTPQ